MNNFYKIWMGDFASDIGNKMLFFAIPILGLNLMGLKPEEIGYVSTIYLSVPLVLGLILGVLADKHYSKNILYICNIVRCIIISLLLSLLSNNYLNWYSLAIGLFLLNAVSLYYDSIMVSIIPLIIPTKQSLIKANSYIEGGNSINSSIGPAISGFLISFFSIKLIFIIDILAYIWSSLLLATTNLKLEKKYDTINHNRLIKNNKGNKYLEEIKIGFKLLFNNPSQRIIIYSVSVYNFFSSWILVVLPIYAIKIIGLSSYHLGLMYLFPFIFGIIGAYFVSYLTEKFSLVNIITYSFIPIAIIILLLPLTKNFGSLFFFILCITILSIMEFCITINLIIDRSIRQSIYPSHHLSKIESTIRFLTWGFDPLGAMIGSLTINFFSVFVSISIGAIGFIIPPIICFFSNDLKKLSLNK